VAVATALAIGFQTNVAVAEEPAPAAEPADTLHGQIAVKDAKTGKLREPTAEEAAELSKQAAKDRQLKLAPTQPKTPTIQTSPSGTKSMVLGDEYMNYEVVRVGPDGKLVHDCVHGAKAAEATLKQIPAELETE
jgi:hypothetical protein